MFGLVLTSIVTAMHVYVFWRFGSVPWVKKRLSLKTRLALFLALWAMFLLGRMYGHGGTGPLAAALEFLGMNWMAALFLVTVCLLLVDIVTVFGLLMKGVAARLRGIAVVAGIGLSVVALFQGMRQPVVGEYDVYLKDLPSEMEGKVIVGISDLHLGSLTGARWLKGLVTRVQSQKPDMIVMLGDIFEGHEPPGDELLSVFHGFSAPMGLWAVPGNHDRHGDGDSFLRLVDANGIRVLADAWAEPVSGFYLVGLNHTGGHQGPDNSGNPIADAFSGKPPGGTTVLMSHTPRYFDQAARSGVGLMLSGHTHGGQIWPFDYLVKRRYPLLEGKHDLGRMSLIICRGTGTWGPRMRLWSPGEIMRITLHGTKEDRRA